MCEEDAAGTACSPVAEGLEAMSLRHARRAAKCFRQVTTAARPVQEFDLRTACEEGRAGGPGGCIRRRSHTRVPEL